MKATVLGRRAQGLLLALVGVAMLLWTRTAMGGSFHDDGTYAFDPLAVARFDFEQELPEPEPGEEPLERVESDTALSGRWVIELGEHQQAEFLVELPALPRTYRVSLWIRGGEGVGFFGVGYTAAVGRLDEIAALYPTGRVTSDGWVEIANEGIRVDGARAQVVAMGVYAPTGAELDAMEVVPDGVIEGEVNPSCQGAVDASACGMGQLCYWSECRNVNGWVPPIPADRENVTQYLENRLRFLFGPFIERTLDMPAVLAAIEQMRHADEPWTYWNGFLAAVRRLHDGHTTTWGTGTYVIDNPKPLSPCFIEGVADLSQGIAPSHPLYHDVLVSHVDAHHNLGLKPGDRLVAVDGKHPVEWARSLVDVNWSQPVVSNHETFAEHISGLRSLISRFAHEIQVIRCDPATSLCSGVQTVSIADIPLEEPNPLLNFVTCDNRPLRHLATSPASHGGDYYGVYSGLLLESNETEKIYGVEWESLMTYGSDGVGANLSAAVNQLTTEGARGAIFDHRTGNGGTTVGADIVWRFAVPLGPISAYQDRQRAEDEQPTLAEGMAVYQQAVDQGWADVGGSSDPSDIPVALLITEDVSASDWLALGMKGAPRVRIFGPYQTNGAFSTRLQFGYWFGMTVQMASGDTYVADGSTLNGRGVEPDVMVLPRQSDLLVGVDTVFEAAIAWIRQELGS